MRIDISSFINWFITQFINIGTSIITIIDSIKIYGNISILDLTITIVIIGMFLELILTIPQNSMSKAERNVREYKANQRKQKKGRKG